jgi:hypothetical protein
MGGNKNFGPTEDFTKQSQPSGKPILVFDPTKPVNFTDLADTIASYSGHGGKFLMVKQTEDGVTVTTMDGILDAISAIEDQLAAIFDADPIAFGKDINFEQFEAMGFRLEQIAGNPATPVNGQLWYDTVAHIAKIYQNNAVQPFFSAQDSAELAALRGELDIAKDDIVTLSNLIGNVADDGVLSRTEKPSIVKEYQAIIADQAGLDSEAVRYGVTTEKVNYDNAISDLTAYLESLDPAWDDYDHNSTIDRATFIQKFNDVYATKQTLINKIHSSTFTVLESTAQEASDANQAAIDAQADAAAALTAINNMSLDNVLTILEKKELFLRVSTINTEQSGIDAEAVEHGVTTEKDNYDTALNNLNVYLDSLSPAWDDNTQDTPIVRADFNNSFISFYDSRQACLNAIARAALNAAEDAQADATAASNTANNAQSAANTALSNANTALSNANAAISAVNIISSDSYLSKGEKPAIKTQYDAILSEQAMLNAQANNYGLSHTTYDNAISALTAYLNSLSPSWSDTTQDTPIVAATFSSKFKDVYDAGTALYLAIYDKARDAATVLADQAAANAHRNRTKVVFDGGFVTAGRFEVGNVAYGDNNAGMSGIVSGTPNTDIRFWAGVTYANRATAPWRVQNDGTMYATKAVIAGWNVDSEAIYKGTKKISDGYATDGITLSGDGSLHAKNIYINANGDVGLRGIVTLDTIPTLNGANYLKMSLSGFDIYESNFGGDTGALWINRIGYQGGQSYYRDLFIGDGKGNYIMRLFGYYNGAPAWPVGSLVDIGAARVQVSGYLECTSTSWPMKVPRLSRATMNAMTINQKAEGQLAICQDTYAHGSQLCVYNNGSWMIITLHAEINAS